MALSLVSKRDRDKTNLESGVTFIIDGAVLSLFIVGIPLLVIGIKKTKYAKANRNSKHECAYYDEENNKIVLYDLEDTEYIVDAKDIKEVPYNKEKFSQKLTVVKNDDQIIDLGQSYSNDIRNLIKKVEELKTK